VSSQEGVLGAERLSRQTFCLSRSGPPVVHCVRRGVWLVLALISVAVMISAVLGSDKPAPLPPQVFHRQLQNA